jgi:hypothetical protein
MGKRVSLIFLSFLDESEVKLDKDGLTADKKSNIFKFSLRAVVQ